MTDMIARIMDAAWRAWRWRGVALLSAWFVCSLGWAVVVLLPDIYKSSAVVYVDTASVLQPLLKGLTIEPNTAAELELMQGTLLGRPNLERVMRETDLDLSVADPAEREALLTSLKNRVSVSRQRSGGAAGRDKSDLFRIEFEDSDPVLARDVVQAVLSIFIESNLGQNRQESELARRFINDQIGDYELQLAEAERRISNFRRENYERLSLSGRGEYPQQFENARQRLANAQAELGRAKVRRDALRGELAAVPQFLPSDTGSTFGPPTSIESQIFSLQGTLDDLLARYTDKHPDVLVTRRKLEALQKQQQAERAVAPPRLDDQGNPISDPAAPGVSNIVYEQLKLLLSQEEATVAALEHTVAEARSEVQRLEALSEGVPEVEAELVKLNRDYDVLRASYDALLASRETERLSRARDLQGEQVRFRIIEPPQVPVVPSGPNHPLFLVAVLIASIGSGTGLAVMLALSSDTFSNANQIKDQLAIAVLGTVSISEVTARSYRATGQSIVFWSGLLLLLAGFAGLMSVELTLGLSQVARGDLMEVIPTDWLRRLPVLY